MNHFNLYRKYRPQSFAEIIGQDVICQTLINSIKLNKVGHSYIFSGPRGTGKTSCARIFAKAINCLNPNDNDACNNCDNCKIINETKTSDLIELDAASNNGVDTIRDIISNVNYFPTNLKRKIYIIDEAHMLTSQAWNALLKVVEEPPSHVVFIFTTTEPQKIITTIKSRCQKHHFFLLKEHLLMFLIEQICKKENVKIEIPAVKKIAMIALGSARDCLSLLDQIILFANNNITLKHVQDSLFLIDYDTKVQFFQEILEQNEIAALKTLDKIYFDGFDLKMLFEELIVLCVDLISFQNTKDFGQLKELNEHDAQKLSQITNNFLDYINIFVDSFQKMKYTKNPLLVSKIITLNAIEKDNMNLEKTITTTSKVPKVKIIKDELPMIWNEQKYEHPTDLFSHENIMINQNILDSYLIKNKIDMKDNQEAFIPKINHDEKKLNIIEKNEANNHLAFNENDIIFSVLSNLDRETANELILKMQNLLSSQKIEDEQFNNLFFGINQKIYLLASNNGVIVLFDTTENAKKFNEYIKNAEILISLAEAFNKAYYWVGIENRKLKEYVNKIKTSSFNLITKMDLKEIKPLNTYESILDIINQKKE